MSITQASSKESAVGLISDEERAALDKVRLDDDVSETTTRTESKTTTVVVEKKEVKFIGPPIPVHRDAMGKYLVPVNEQPLTAYDVPTPGPANYAYDYNVIAHRFPVFSLGERPPDIKRTKGKRTPAPNKYNLQKDPVWGRCRKFPIGIRLPDSDSKASPGPAAYSVPRDICKGPKFTMGLKDERVIGGLVSKLVTIPDPLLPGPDFCPSSEEWLQKPKSFGVKSVSKKKAPGPGPGRYMVRDKELGGPKWKMGIRTFKDKKLDQPGPGDYGFNSTIGEGPKYYIGRAIHEKPPRFITPGANMYNRAGFSLDEPGFTMKYRWFDTKPRKAPGPWSYSVKEDVVKPKPPAYTMSKKTKPTYPANVYSAAGPEGPGPGDYTLPEVAEITGKSFGEKHVEFQPTGPAPADCQELELVNVNRPTAPSYSFGGKYLDIIDWDVPGPQEYDVKFSNLVEPSGKTMGMSRSSKSAATPGPGPNAYLVDTKKPLCPHSMGHSVSSRHTPFKFNGVGHRVVLRDPPKGVPPAPLIG